MSLFITNYSREMRMGANVRRKKKVKKMIEFVERMKKIQKGVKVVLRKA